MATGTQRLRPSPLTGGSNLEAPGAADGLGTGVGADGVGAGVGVGADGLGELGAGKRGLDGGGAGKGAAQETSMPTIASLAITFSIRYKRMLLILLEALGAGLILVLIVWWTMFHGRQSGEREKDPDEDK
jgi:hypothetical protein